jgi:ketosteroid isomerase-like protein
MLRQSTVGCIDGTFATSATTRKMETMWSELFLPGVLAAALSAAPALSGAAATDAARTDPSNDVRDAETAFAGAFAARDAAKFASFLAKDAVFLSPPTVMKGPAEVMARWSKHLGPKVAPFSWKPEHVAVNAAGTIGFSTGPVFDAKGTQIAVYTSVWVRQEDGRWKILFDGPGCEVAPEKKE